MKNKTVTPNIDRFAMKNFASNPYELIWEKMYLLLEKYKQEHGNCEVPTSYQTSCGKNLGIWLKRQCKEIENGNLDIVKVKRLDTLGCLF